MDKLNFDCQRCQANNTYHVSIELGNLQPHQAEVLAILIDKLEEHGGIVDKYIMEND